MLLQPMPFAEVQQSLLIMSVHFSIRQPPGGIQTNFLRVPASVRTDMRTETPLSSRKELIQVEVQCMRKDRVALQPLPQPVGGKGTAVFLLTIA